MLGCAKEKVLKGVKWDWSMWLGNQVLLIGVYPGKKQTSL